MDVPAGATVALVALAAMLGLLVGSFLNVVIVRVPAGLSVVRPGSSCPGCGTPVWPRDNVPVVSWLVLRGRARCCGEPIGVRYPLVEAGTALAFGAVAAATGWSWLLPALLYLAAISVALTAIDLRLKRLPNAIVLPSYPVAAVLLSVPALAWSEPGRLLRAAVCAAALYGFYFLLMLVNPRGMGFGDVKLAGVLGLYLGWFGWAQAVVGTFLAFVLGGLAGLALIVVGRAGRRSAIPFGPFMIVATWIALAVSADVADWYLRTSGLR